MSNIVELRIKHLHSNAKRHLMTFDNIVVAKHTRNFLFKEIEKNPEFTTLLNEIFYYIFDLRRDEKFEPTIYLQFEIEIIGDAFYAGDVSLADYQGDEVYPTLDTLAHACQEIVEFIRSKRGDTH